MSNQSNFGKIDSGRKVIGDVVAAQNPLKRDTGVEWHTTTVGMVAAAPTDVELMGIPVIYNGTDFEEYVAQDIASATEYVAENGLAFKCAIVVGDEAGYGNNHEDHTLDVTPSNVTVLYSGDVAVLYSQVFADKTTPEAVAFKAEMSRNRVIAAKEAPVVTSTYNA